MTGDTSLEGKVMINGDRMVWTKYRNVIGFVMQRDIFNENLKIEEILNFVINLLAAGKNNLEK